MILIHVGYHKTATTWAQQRFFVAERGFFQVLGHRDVDRLIVRPTNAQFDPTVVRAALKAKTDRAAHVHQPVISSELLVGNPFFGGWEWPILAQRLREVFPDARILVTVREQQAAIRAIYMQYLQRGGRLSVTDFVVPTSEPGYRDFDRNHFMYSRLIAYYQELFGPERVLVLPYELLRDDAKRFCALIYSFTEVSPSSRWQLPDTRRTAFSPQEFVAPILRQINRVRTGPMNPRPATLATTAGDLLYRSVARVSSAKWLAPAMRFRPVSHVLEGLLAGHYGSDNGRLRELVPSGVRLPGYEMPAFTSGDE